MSDFKVKTQGLRKAVDEEEALEKKLKSIYDQVIWEKNSVSFKIGSTRNIRNRLNNVSNEIQGECQTLRRMRDRLSQTAGRYEKTENTICDVVKDGKVTNWDKFRTNSLVGDIGKTARNTLLDIITKFGDAGGSVSLLASLAKIMLDGNGWSASDTISMLKGGKASVESIMKIWKFAGEANKTADDWKKLFGLGACGTIVKDSQAEWFKNAGDTFGKTFMDKLGIETTSTGATAVKGATIAGWGLSLAANAVSNYDEYKKGDITAGRAWAETFVETGVDIVKGAAITAAVAAGAAAIGISAPAVVVAGVGVVVSAGLDFACKKITGAVFGEEKGLTETISDAAIDIGEKVVSGVTDMAKEAGKALSGAWSSAKNAFCGWGKAMGYA